MGMQMVRRRNAVAAMSILAIMCCWGCSASEKAVRWDLEPDEIPGFLAETGSLPDATVTITDLPVPLVITKAEQEEIIKALEKDTHHIEIDDRYIAGASFTIQFRIILFRGPEALMIGLDPLGFGIGLNDGFRFANPSLARTLERVLKRNGVSQDSYREMLACGAAGPPPEPPEVRESDNPQKGSEVAVQAIEYFFHGARQEEIAVRVQRTGGTEIGLDDNEALPNSLVEDSWPSQRDKVVVSAAGRRDALEITVWVHAKAIVVWLDESGFCFGKEGQYRFDNPSLARQIEKLFRNAELFQTPDSVPTGMSLPTRAGKGDKYKRMLEAAAGKKRPEGSATQAAREKGKVFGSGPKPAAGNPGREGQGVRI